MSQPGVGNSIRVGIGGWTYDAWRGSFYPAAWPKARELEYAGAHLGAIEINSTFYGTQKPATFAKWRDATPDGFVFSVKASRYATHRRVLAEAGASIDRFIQSGIAELGAKLGPIVWQFAPTKPFERDDFAAFLELLPSAIDGLPLRHAVEVRHASFVDETYLALVKQREVATVFTDSAKYPSFADVTGGFVYARLMRAEPALESGYPREALRQWARAVRQWSVGDEPPELPRLSGSPAASEPREVYVFFINGAKERAPGAALALIEALSR